MNSTEYPNARFWDRIANRYARKPVPDQQVYEEKLRLTEERLTADMTVLDIGCGTGTTALHHAGNVKHIRAIDVSARMVEIARGKAQQQGIVNVEFEVGDIEGLGIVDGTYDLVLAHSILHLLDDVEGLLRSLNRVMKPDGILVSSTTCLADFMPVFKYIVPIGKFVGLMPYVKVFSASDLAGWFDGAGFELEHDWQPSPKSGHFQIHRKVRDIE